MKRCKNCGACTECGAPSYPRPYPVYPWPVAPSPYPPYVPSYPVPTWTRPYYVGDTTAVPMAGDFHYNAIGGATNVTSSVPLH